MDIKALRSSKSRHSICSLSNVLLGLDSEAAASLAFRVHWRFVHQSVAKSAFMKDSCSLVFARDLTDGSLTSTFSAA